MKVNFRNQEIDVEVKSDANELLVRHYCQFGLYKINIFNFKDDADVSVEISTTDVDDLIEELFFSEEDSMLDILQESFNIISEDIDLKREIVEEYQQVLDSVKDYI